MGGVSAASLARSLHTGGAAAAGGSLPMAEAVDSERAFAGVALFGFVVSWLTSACPYNSKISI